MARTRINWADEVWNWLLGCSRCSDGCDLCYAIRETWIHSFNPNHKVAAAFEGLARKDRDTGQLDWTGTVRFLPERLGAPLNRVAPARWFVNSLSDVFHPAVKAEWICRGLAVMAACPRHTFLLLTKRHARMRALLNSPAFRQEYECAYQQLVAGLTARQRRREPLPATAPWPIPNLHLGVSAENQEAAAIRIPELLRCRGAAGVLWVSAEPLVSPVKPAALVMPRTGRILDALTGTIRHPGLGTGGDAPAAALDWLVAGGESGRGARPCQPEWLLSLRDQCADAGVAFWMKQTGAVLAQRLGIPGAGDEWDDLPPGFRVRELPGLVAA